MLSSQSITKDNVPSIIEEPPLKNRRSCLRRGLGLLFSLVLLGAIGLTIIALFFSAPKPLRLASLPANFPLSIPLYKFEDRTGINYYPGERKDRLRERLAAAVFKPEKWPGLPKTLLSPSVVRQIDTVAVSWQNLPASLRTIESFYRRRLEAEKFAIGVVRREPTHLTLIFNKEAITGTLQINQPKGAGSDVVLSVDYKPVH